MCKYLFSEWNGNHDDPEFVSFVQIAMDALYKLLLHDLCHKAVSLHPDKCFKIYPTTSTFLIIKYDVVCVVLQDILINISF